MIFEIEVPVLSIVLAPPVDAKEPTVIRHATVSDLYFEEGDEIEEREFVAGLFNDHEMREIAAPATGVLISLTYEEGDTVASEAVLAKIQTDR